MTYDIGEGRYNRVGSGLDAVPPQRSPMVQMYTRLADCTERMMAIRQSLGRTADSLLGAVPESNQKEPGEREKPSGSIAALNQMITRIEHLLVPLEQLATRYAELDSGNS